MDKQRNENWKKSKAERGAWHFSTPFSDRFSPILLAKRANKFIDGFRTNDSGTSTDALIANNRLRSESCQWSDFIDSIPRCYITFCHSSLSLTPFRSDPFDLPPLRLLLLRELLFSRLIVQAVTRQLLLRCTRFDELRREAEPVNYRRM